jgi:hypothetical protein
MFRKVLKITEQNFLTIYIQNEQYYQDIPNDALFLLLILILSTARCIFFGYSPSGISLLGDGTSPTSAFLLLGVTN